MEQNEATQPAVDFQSERRIHIGFGVSDLERSVEFYRALFAQDPSKLRPGYAKFEPADPSVNLSLVEADDAGTTAQLPSHFGIQVKSPEAVRAMAQRLAEAGLSPRLQEQVGCCYAVQDKAWVTDPDGHAWEIFVVTDSENAPLRPEPDDSCCTSTGAGATCC
ncbi:MAG: VOC family protein [Myxococcales bacterium]|nr:VOC family protein [Myxococcales bacterium]MDD9971462.1 VOC family protein [Myxococcales bacterium]